MRIIVDLSEIRSAASELAASLLPAFESFGGIGDEVADFLFGEFHRRGLDIGITTCGAAPGASDHVIRLGIGRDFKVGASARCTFESDSVVAHNLILLVDN